MSLQDAIAETALPQRSSEEQYARCLFTGASKTYEHLFSSYSKVDGASLLLEEDA